MSELSTNTKQSKNLTEKLVDKYVLLEDGEELLLLARKHWAVFRNSVLLALFVPFVLLFLVYFFNVYPLDLTDDLVHYLTMGLLVASAVAFVLGSLGFLWRLYVWHHNLYVMTSKKLAIINQSLPWEYDVQQIDLRNINDVTLKQTGLQSLIYGYSDVIAVTYSGTQFVLKDVGRPSDVQKAIMSQLTQQKGGGPPSAG